VSRLAAAEDGNLDGLTRVQAEDGRGDRFSIDDCRFSDSDDDITDDQTRPVRGRPFGDFGQQEPDVVTGEPQRDDESVNAEPGAGIARALAGDEALHGGAWNRQCQAAADHRVDADDPAAGIDKGTARVTGAQGDVGLEPVPGARTFEGSGLASGDDDAGRGRTSRSWRVSDRNRDLTRSHGAGIGEAGGGQAIGSDLEDRQVAVGVTGGDDTGELATVVKDDVDAIVPDYVTIGYDDAVGAPDDTGAMASAMTDEND
jgi:hypothetical protein